MKVGFAIGQDEGIGSRIYGHFGSAPAFLIVDTEGGGMQTIKNADLGHIHGACSPLKALGGNRFEALVVGGIGGGALMKLSAMGVKVYAAGAQTVRENLELFKADKLSVLSLDHACRAHQGGCGH